MDDGWERFLVDKAIGFAIEGLKGAMLLNGGGAIALMTLLGAVTSKGPDAAIRVQIEPAKYALSLFGYGLLASVATFGVAYGSQLLFAEASATGRPTSHRVAAALRIIGFTCFAVSLALFVFGVRTGADAIGPR